MRQRRKKLVDYKAELAQREATGADSPEGLKCTITITDQAVTIEWDPFLPDGPHEVTKDRAPAVGAVFGMSRAKANAPPSAFLRNRHSGGPNAHRPGLPAAWIQPDFRPSTGEYPSA